MRRLAPTLLLHSARASLRGVRNPNATDARFCSTCGARLATPMTPTPEVRKTVTIVFCDVVGSTSLAEGLDAESWGEIMVRYFDRMSAALKHHGGSIEKFIGDAVMAVFGLPTAHEDDALRAVRAAADMRSSLAELNETLDREFGIRIMSRTGIHTGEIVASGAVDQPMPLGDAANTAARIRAGRRTRRDLDWRIHLSPREGCRAR